MSEGVSNLELKLSQVDKAAEKDIEMRILQEHMQQFKELRNHKIVDI